MNMRSRRLGQSRSPQYTYIIRLTVTVHTDYCARMELHLRNTATCQKAPDVSLLPRDSGHKGGHSARDLYRTMKPFDKMRWMRAGVIYFWSFFSPSRKDRVQVISPVFHNYYVIMNRIYIYIISRNSWKEQFWHKNTSKVLCQNRKLLKSLRKRSRSIPFYDISLQLLWNEGRNSK